MNQFKKLGILAFIILFPMSCTSLRYQIKKNKSFTYKMVSDILEYNDNVFCLGTEYSNTSFIWTYRGNSIQMFKLINGSVNTEKKFELENDIEWLLQYSNDSLLSQIFECTELDGDLLEIWIKKDNEIEEFKFPLNIECFVRGNYESIFLSRVAEDMKKYHIKLK